jgi:hypothetical protein
MHSGDGIPAEPAFRLGRDAYRDLFLTELALRLGRDAYRDLFSTELAFRLVFVQ